jgi:anti-sigma factor (TIGR02949 family)
MSDIDHRSCAQVFARLDEYVDRELSADDLEQVQKHLEICAMCAAEFRLEGQLLRTIRGKVRRIALPQGFEARIWKKIHRGTPREPGEAGTH